MSLSVNSISKCRVRISLAVALFACLISWLIVGETSPLADYFLWHVEIPNLWSALHVVPYLIIMIFRPAPFDEAITFILVFLQWLLIGYVLARLICRIRHPTDSH